jgi:hypothetical protein
MRTPISRVLDAAEFQKRVAAGDFGRYAGAKIVVDVQLKMTRDFVREVALAAGVWNHAREPQ